MAPQSSRQPDATVSHQTTPPQPSLHPSTTTETNPTQQQAAQVATVFSGSDIVAVGVGHVIGVFAGGDAARLRSVRVRSRGRRPVSAGEDVRTEMWFVSAQGGGGHDRMGGHKTILCRQVVREEGGEDVVVADAVVELWDRGRIWEPNAKL
ncbi:hypothetical protein Micbo1qcDRAFT_201800 [Microdochium bolleyi]|uniref:Uncharacterized protein n=1 Tax=Microdochium bolleyi TaxID=196109 RepID=A0A136J9J9_9PEZI|nr:hypothetical protein Micbo1qcDRAFT_201800 [Microdochium bolleyi]